LIFQVFQKHKPNGASHGARDARARGDATGKGESAQRSRAGHADMASTPTNQPSTLQNLPVTEDADNPIYKQDQFRMYCLK
jgi:hypothetical protein